MANNKEARILIYNDTHNSSVYGLWHPNFIDKTGLKRSDMNPVMKTIWGYWKDDFVPRVKKWKPTHIWLPGDLIDGPNKFHQGKYLVTPDLNDQAENFLMCARMLPEAEIEGVAGSDYHNSSFFDAHQYIIEELGGNFNVFDFVVEILGHVFHVSHGRSFPLVQVEQNLAREVTFNAISSYQKKYPEVEVIIIGHWHIWREIRGPFGPKKDWRVIVSPCWQGQDEYMKMRSPLRMVPDVGATFLTVTEEKVIVDRVLYPTPVVVNKPRKLL